MVDAVKIENITIANKASNHCNIHNDCKLIPLTRGAIAHVDTDLYNEISIYKWHLKGSDTNNCAARKKGADVIIRMHRLIMNAPDNMVVDHINHNTLDNRRCNLRICTEGENQRNRRPRKSQRYTPYKGVMFDKNVINGRPWTANITINGKRIRLGCFFSDVNAATCYNLAAALYHKEFAFFNTPDLPLNFNFGVRT